MMNELLILVDENDNEIGMMDKLSVHQKGLLHRAFSVFIFNSNHELLLQQRANDKYHSAGLWSNTCCSHSNNSEPIADSVKRRLKEEMGLETETQFEFSFLYKADFENGLKEHELDHVYLGTSDEKPRPDITEVMNWKYISLEKLAENISIHPENYTEWLKICLPEVERCLKQKNLNKIFNQNGNNTY
jgi:isopentenyl-diphosphate Delta-isomerase